MHNQRFRKGFIILAGGLSCILVALLISRFGVFAGFGVLVFPLVVAYAYMLFRFPKVGIYTTLAISFFAVGLNRYLPGPLGLLLDANMVLTFLAVLVNQKVDKSLKLLNNVAFITTFFWFVFCLFQLFNPLAVSRVAWFFAVRGVALYAILGTPVLLWLFRSRRDLWQFVNAWILLAMLGSLWGIKQNVIGLDFAEQRWLNEGGAVTHILFGKLRVFSFFSDAGQFGAVMGSTAVLSGILCFSPVRWKQKVFYAFATVLCVYGLLISGTRGSFFILAAGGLLFLILIKNFKLFALGLFLGVGLLGVLKFTFIGQSNYHIARLRTALDPEDASLQVRLDNQKKLSYFMADKPFGNGIGSGGSWAIRFSPGTFLAETALDSWYVKIWAETGVVGLLMHIGFLLTILFKASISIMRQRYSLMKFLALGLCCSYFGVIVAAYGNQIYGQAPTGFNMIFAIAALSLMKSWSNGKLSDRKL